MPSPSIIDHRPRAGEPTPNVTDYAALCSAFSWEKARAQLSGLPCGRGLNIAHEAVDRHQGSSRDYVAVRWLGRNGARRDITYGELAQLSSRFANVLAGLAVDKGDVVCTLLGRVPALCVTALGALKRRAVFCPLTWSLAPSSIEARLQQVGARVLITTRRLYAGRIEAIRARVPSLAHVLLIDDDAASNPVPGTLAYAALMQRAFPSFEIGTTSPDDPALLCFTRGLRAPKPVLHVHEAVVLHHITGQHVLDMRPGDVVWCTADPAQMTGLAYGLIAPLTNRGTLVLDEGELDPQRWYETLERESVSVFYSSPDAYRALLRHDGEARRKFDLSPLRVCASAGETLDAELVMQGEACLGRPVLDTYAQTETGGIMLANYATQRIKAGSLGRPIAGIDARVVRRLEGGSLQEVEQGEGELALRTSWPSRFRGYCGQSESTDERFEGDWYLTGDRVRRDADGDYWFTGRVSG